MVKVLIAGAGGGLGQAFAARMEGPFEVVALGHRALDVTRRNDVFARVQEIRPEIVVDAAGYTDVDRCEYEKWQAYLVNRDGADHLARAAASVGALMVYPSSDLVFDGQRLLPYREEDPPNPLSVYGDTKLAGELAVMNGALRHLIVRTGWLFGSHGRSYLNDLLAWRDTEEIAFGFEDQRSQPTLQSDFVAAVAELVGKGQTGLFHVANDGEATQFQFAQKTCEILGVKTMDVRPLRRGGSERRVALRPRYSALDCKKVESLGIRMRPWAAALREHLASRSPK
jgi:dTDP-4-dehydrorhamnose reductase